MSLLEPKKTTLTTFSLPHARKPKLWYRDGEGVYQSLAVLTVSPEEFWATLERELGIRFVDAPSTP